MMWDNRKNMLISKYVDLGPEFLKPYKSLSDKNSKL